MIKNICYIILIALVLAGCDANDDLSPNVSDTGVAGSYARFIVVGDFMYIVDNTGIKTFSLENPDLPVEIDQQNIGERIESIFHLDGRLFIGSGAGLFIYQIESDGKPSQLSATPYFQFWDQFSCDPVVATDSFAYVTLNTIDRISRCGQSINVETNLLKIFDVTDLTNPLLLAEYELFGPKGVGIDDKTLFICDHTEGLKIYDVHDPNNIQLIKQFDYFTAFDVIPLDGLLLVVGPENVYQFDYSDLENIVEVSQIAYGS